MFATCSKLHTKSNLDADFANFVIALVYLEEFLLRPESSNSMNLGGTKVQIKLLNGLAAHALQDWISCPWISCPGLAAPALQDWNVQV